MISFFWRIVKRFAVLVPGIAIAFFSVHSIFPLIDRRVPDGVAVFVTYILGAYVLIPAVIRLLRIIVPTKHLQSYCVTPDGFASDPINIGIIGSKRELIEAMEMSGWFVADKLSIRTVIRAGVSVIANTPYVNAPMSRLYLFGRKQDIGFEIPIEGERGNRHHVRFWATSYKPGAKFNFGTIEWHKERAPSVGKNTLWVGAASRDIGLALIRHNAQMTHMIHFDTDRERELIVNQLAAKNLVAHTSVVRLGNPYRLINRALRGQLHTDGKLRVVKLRKSSLRHS